MGVEQSRLEQYPSNIDEMYEIYETYTQNNKNNNHIHQHIKENHLNLPKKGMSTLPEFVIEIAANDILEYLTKTGFKDQCKILDVFSGNGIASNIIHKKLNVEMKSTDALDLSMYMDENSYPVEFNLTGVDAVKKYSGDEYGYNTLLMICPPPSSLSDSDGEDISILYSSYSDYFTIKEWAKVKSAKLFIFVGEMGASDGSSGLYHYMLENNPDWKLEYREMLHFGYDIFGGDVEKELFIFSKI